MAFVRFQYGIKEQNEGNTTMGSYTAVDEIRLKETASKAHTLSEFLYFVMDWCWSLPGLRR